MARTPLIPLCPNGYKWGCVLAKHKGTSFEKTKGKPHRPAAPGQRCYVSAPPTPPPTADTRLGQNSCSSKLITAPSESSAISRSLGLKRHAKQGNRTNCVPFYANEFRFRKFCSLALHRRKKIKVSLLVDMSPTVIFQVKLTFLFKYEMNLICMLHTFDICKLPPLRYSYQ